MVKDQPSGGFVICHALVKPTVFHPPNILNNTVRIF